MARVHVVLAVLAVPSVAAAQANQADFQARFDRALVVFNSPRQPEAIPQFSQLIDDLRAPAQSIQRQTTLLARALQYRAQARENVGQAPMPMPTCASFAKCSNFRSPIRDCRRRS
jgi:hypothetical protein